MRKRLVHISKRVYHRSTEFAVERPNAAVALLICLGIMFCIALWLLIVPIFAPETIAPYMHAGALR